MDDLSDAVLQGMVWLQWQRNLEALIRERPDLLEEV
jgi:cruciform cutting endonuclease 1